MILDSSAVVALLLNEPEAQRFHEALIEADTVAIGAPTLLECELVISALLGPEGLLKLDELMEALDAEILSFSERELALARSASRAYSKGRHRAGLNYGDCFSYAFAVSRDEPLLFKGNDFTLTDVPVAQA